MARFTVFQKEPVSFPKEYQSYQRDGQNSYDDDKSIEHAVVIFNSQTLITQGHEHSSALELNAGKCIPHGSLRWMMVR